MDDIVNQTTIHLEYNGVKMGKFIFKNKYRAGLNEVFKKLCETKNVCILSGDNDGEMPYLKKILPPNSEILFNQKPEDKLEFIKQLQDKNNTVMMLGDGLNDAGALAQSDVGVSVSENINVFSPACDGILDAERFAELPKFLLLTNKTMTIIKASFILSFLYNIVGLLFAITGNLSPIIAAILMPISSISVVVFVTISSNIIAKKMLY